MFRRLKLIAFRELRVNDQIRIPTVRLFDDTTEEAFGVVPLDRAKQLAVERELDLVEVAPQAQPPVCRLMDYGRFKFEALKRDKESRKEHSVVHVKEMKLRPKISEHDFQTKFGYVRQFLKGGNKVKITITFRGREMVHQEFGRRLLDRMAEGLKEVAAIERMPLLEGRNMIMIMSPASKKSPKPENGSAPPLPAAKAAPVAAPQAVATPVAAAPEPAKEPAASTAETEPAPAAEPAAVTAEAEPAAQKPKTTRAKTTTASKPKAVTAKPAAKRTTTKGATSNAKDQKS